MLETQASAAWAKSTLFGVMTVLPLFLAPEMSGHTGSVLDPLSNLIPPPGQPQALWAALRPVFPLSLKQESRTVF